MSILNVSGPGPEIKNQIGTVPAAQAAGAVNGTGVSRVGFNYAVLEVQTGVTTGTPGSFTLDAKLQHSDVIGSGYVDVTGAAVSTVTAASSRKRKTVDLRTLKPFVRVVTTAAFVGGTSPTICNVVTLQLAGADILPAQSDD
jgi:hypothetical protein